MKGNIRLFLFMTRAGDSSLALRMTGWGSRHDRDSILLAICMIKVITTLEIYNVIAMIYSAITRDIKVTVLPSYREEPSSPPDNHYVWNYAITIENHSGEEVQLQARHWRIVDEKGHIQEVKGDGVVGKQPFLPPNAVFEYSSHVILSCPSGMMMGSYRMVVPKTGEKFDIGIPAFSLDVPDSEILPN